jgi:hypothetical protein
MPIEIRNAEDYRNKTGNLGKALLVAHRQTKIYEVNSKGKSCLANFNIVNFGQEDANLTIWISFAKVPDVIDLYETKLILKPDSVYFRTGIVLSPSESVFVRSTTDNVVVRIEGFENNVY